MNYKIDKENQIVLYGFNIYTKEQVESLRRNGFAKLVIVDKRAEQLKCFDGVNIISDINQLSNKDNTLVFIMLQNAMIHADVAKELIKMGLSKILCIPMIKGFDDAKLFNLIIKYNYMMKGDYDLLVDIPIITDEIYVEENISTYEKVMSLADCDIVYVPIEYIHTTLREPNNYDDISIAQFKPYCNLMDYIMGGNADIKEYIELFGIVNDEVKDREKTIIEKRKKLIDYFEYQFDKGMKYFILSAPEAEWNDKGYLNLKEGQHRSIYLIKKGMKKIPVRVEKKISKTLYEKLQ